MLAVGGVVSGALYVTVSVAVAVLPAASRAVTVKMLSPGCSAMLFAAQLVVPAAVPCPPRLLAQVTCVAARLSPAVPPRLTGLVLVVYVAPLVGVVIATVGAVGSYVTVSVAVPALFAASFA